MTKFVSVTARVAEESVAYISRMSNLFNIDKSTAFRKLLHRGILEDKKEKALELYLKGDLSIESAAKFAGIYIWEFLCLLEEKGIESNVTMEDFKESLQHARKLHL